MTFKELKHARRDLFRDPRVIEHIGQATALDPRIVDTACKTLLEADLLPCASDEKADALAINGAVVLMALGSRQTRPDAIVSVVSRLRDMEHQLVIGPVRSSEATNEPKRRPPDLFVHGVAEVIKQTWERMRPPFDYEDADVGVSVLWRDRGEVLYGVIDHESDHRRYVYSNVTLPVPPGITAEREFVELTTVGGQIFTTMSIFQYAWVLKDSAVSTSAELDELRSAAVLIPRAGIHETQPTLKKDAI